MRVPLSGTHLVEASAGTGKTFTIVSLVVRLLVEERLPIRSIAAVTFTNAATSELKERVAGRLRQAIEVLEGAPLPEGDDLLASLLRRPDRDTSLDLLREALRDVDSAGIFTIHGFAARTLQEQQLQRRGADPLAQLVGDQSDVVLDIATDFYCQTVALLPAPIFRLLGGESLFSSLAAVARQAAATFEVEVVQLPPAVDIEEKLAEFTTRFSRARAAFANSGGELLQLLVDSPALNRTMMKPAALEKDYQSYLRYFDRDDPCFPHPESERFTLSKVLRSIKKDHTAPTHPLLEELGMLREHSLQLQLDATRFADHLRKQLAQVVSQRLASEQGQRGTQSFDGLLTELCVALRDEQLGAGLAAEVRQRYPVALIDEFQDTDPVQYEIFRRIYGENDQAIQGGAAADQQKAQHSASQRATERGRAAHGALFLIGDPKQSIYAFRGADVFTYLRASRSARAGVWTLTTSYRADPTLVSAQNCLLGYNRQPFGAKEIVYDAVSPRSGASNRLCDRLGEPLAGMQIVLHEEGELLEVTAHQVASFLAEAHTIEGRAVVASDVAVLTRSNAQAAQLKELLVGLGVPAVMHGDRSVFESAQALELLRVLRALAEPNNQVRMKSALASPLIGLGAQQLRDLDHQIDQLEMWVGRLKDWGRLWRSHGIARATAALFSELQLTSKILSTVGGERAMTNLRHLLELLHEAEIAEHLGVRGMLRWLETAIAHPSGHSMAAEARQLRLESDERAVTLTTIHKSKGLEYGVVFLPTLGKADRVRDGDAYRYFDREKQRSQLELRAAQSRDEHSLWQHSLDARQEDLRLCYVALTRAKHRVVALLNFDKGFSPLGYLLWEQLLPHPGGLPVALDSFKSIDVELRRQTLQNIAKLSQGAIEVSPARTVDRANLFQVRTWETLRAPSSVGRVEECERVSSFSAMTRDAQLSRAQREGRDVSDVEDTASHHLSASSQSETILLAEFPRGPGPGDALHLALEACPFAEGDEQQRQIIAKKVLLENGLKELHADQGARAISQVLSTPLPGVLTESRPLLGQLSQSERIAEMEFSLPVTQLSHQSLLQTISEAASFDPQKHESEVVRDLPVSYMKRLSSLEFEKWAGFLRGFIDLVFDCDGRLYGVDYKSNYLGSSYGDYSSSATARSMDEHHYWLQALIYSVALHRLGQLRVPDYDYEKHFGGMFYLYVRGMHPQRSTGMLRFFPRKELVETLSERFGKVREPQARRRVESGELGYVRAAASGPAEVPL